MTEVDDPRAKLVAVFEATGKLATNPVMNSAFERSR